ncbi:hypothetical protein BGZ98_010065 [Dissophora globulifera]|nr:hypothetical protein BGZ98_010065 [Dissophora globulifera]
MGSPWDQLEQMLRSEQHRQGRQEQGQEDREHQQRGHVFSSIGHAPPRQLTSSEEDDFVVPTKSLQAFLQTGERMFVDLEESVYVQLYAHFKSFLAQMALSTAPSTTPPTPQLYISLALVFGTTITTPKEQYMIRIGPLEPQQAVNSGPAAALPLRLSPDAAPQAESELPFAKLDQDRRQTTPDVPRNGVHLLGAIEQPRIQQQQQRQLQEEKSWERKLVQQIMGISSMLPEATQQLPDPSSVDLPFSSLADPIPAARSKVHLLMKAPSGLVFQGMLPKQMIQLEEDYGLSDLEAARKNEGHVRSRLGAAGSAGKKRNTRWPIHHVHVLGPSSSPSSPSSARVLSHTDSVGAVKEIWYQVGGGIPILSPLL